MKIKARKGSIVLMSVVVVVALLMGGLTSAIAEPRVIEVPEDYPTIQDAVDFAAPGDKIIVGPGEYSGATVNKPVEIKGEDGAVIVDGPPYDLDPTIKTGFFLEPGISSGVTISEFTFFVDLPVFGRSVDDVTVKHNVMNAPLQGVTCVRGSRWVIKHNDINGLRDLPLGGIGIWIVSTDIPSLPANDNLVAFNKITGDFPDPSGFIRAGIGLSSWGGQVTGNKIVHNRVVMTGDLAFPIGMAAWVAAPPPQTYLFSNKISFNDLRGSTLELVGCLPPNLQNFNVISRNLGENRAYDGIPPNEFKPVI